MSAWRSLRPLSTATQKGGAAPVARKRSRGFVVLVLAGATLLGTALAGAHARVGSARPAADVAVGALANGASSAPVVSANGRYVAFQSYATNLVSDDTNVCVDPQERKQGPCPDIFVRDRVAGTTERVSVSSGGAQADAKSEHPSMSAEGRFVAFMSSASNLVTGDTNAVPDVFVHDRLAGTTERVNVSGSGVQADSPSGLDGGLSISADGRFVAFMSFASNLVAGDTNAASDVFVHDRVAGTTERVSVGSDGAQARDGSYGSAISGDGRFVSFRATNLLPGNMNLSDVLVHDRLTETTERASVSGDGALALRGGDRPTISADGRFVAFMSWAPNAVAGDTIGPVVSVRDRVAGTTERVSLTSGGAPADLGSMQPAISADGRFVAFMSYASNLVAHDTNDCFAIGASPTGHYNCPDIFVRDRVAGTTERVSVSSGGAQADAVSADPAISADGRFVAFGSSNLVAGDTDQFADVFVRDRATNTTTLISVALGSSNTVRPSIPKSGHPGDVIVCNPGTWTGSPSFTFTWTRDGILIAGQTGRSYTLAYADVGHPLRCRVTAHNIVDTSADSNALLATPLRLQAGRLLLLPWPPRAGKQLTATMRVSVGGEPISAARLSCAATLGGRKLAATTRSFLQSSGRCVWNVPRAARHKRLKGSVVITTATGTAGKSFAGKVR
jgi:Tol biopolymer transport system component